MQERAAITYHVKGIVWDTDGEEVEGLPESMTITVPYYPDLTLEETDEYVADWISDHYGWCISELRVSLDTTPEP